MCAHTRANNANGIKPRLTTQRGPGGGEKMLGHACSDEITYRALIQFLKPSSIFGPCFLYVYPSFFFSFFLNPCSPSSILELLICLVGTELQKTRIAVAHSLERDD